MSSPSSPSALPVRRIVTGHTPEGKAIILEDKQLERVRFNPNSPSLFAGVYRHDSFPASNADGPSSDGKNGVKFRDLISEKPKELMSPSGSTLWTVEMPPGGRTPFHRTVSLDYAIITHGTLTLVLDDDKRVKLYPGDVLIQRGTIHAFVNEGKEWSRMYAVMIPSEKIRVYKELDVEFRQ